MQRRNGTFEMALNPSHFRTRTIEDVLSTLVHEMAHLWQHHYGKPSRPGYHNAQWANRMRTLGLIPSSTNQPGGKETGQKMGHYIAEHGAFATAVAALLADGYALPTSSCGATTKRVNAKRRRAARPNTFAPIAARTPGLSPPPA
jgi:hypothetical protein